MSNQYIVKIYESSYKKNWFKILNTLELTFVQLKIHINIIIFSF